jgi:hypothetical protein
MKGTQRAQSNCRDPEIASKGRHLKKINAGTASMLKAKTSWKTFSFKRRKAHSLS